MTTKTNTGFTIIETMLFLGVAGALTVAILAGSGVAINQQRYRDSVNTLKSFIQQQYSEVANVVNDRQGTEACDNAIIAHPPAIPISQPRGTSECVVLGRFIVIDSTGAALTASNVIGYRTPGAKEATSDILEVKTNYKLGLSTIGQETTDVAWGAVVVKQQTSQPMTTSILILRSPLSGAIMTYVTEGKTDDLSSLVAIENSNKTTNLCVNAAPGSFAGSRMAVQVSPFATNQGSVQIPLESANVCD
jgi:type II secretory pathway pseudopilin PulG